MKKFLTALLLLLVLVPASALAQGRKSYVIGFYNLENLFDTYHDEGKNDYEYLPDGANEWTEFKYEKKLANMARVIRAMRDENKAYHAILGVTTMVRTAAVSMWPFCTVLKCSRSWSPSPSPSPSTANLISE